MKNTKVYVTLLSLLVLFCVALLFVVEFGGSLYAATEQRQLPAPLSRLFNKGPFGTRSPDLKAPISVPSWSRNAGVTSTISDAVLAGQLGKVQVPRRTAANRPRVWIPLDLNDGPSLLPLASVARNRKSSTVTPPIFILSAFFDNRPLLFGNDSRILFNAGVLRKSFYAGQIWWARPGSLACVVGRFASKHSKVGTFLTQRAFPAIVEVVAKLDQHGRSYIPALIRCEIPRDDAELFHEAGAYVTLIPNPEKFTIFFSMEERWIPLELMPGHPYAPFVSELSLKNYLASPNASADVPISVCTPPIRGDLYGKHLKSWTEFQRISGVETIFIYNQSVAANSPTGRIIDEYVSSGIFDVVQWILPPRNQGEVETWNAAVDLVALRFKTPKSARLKRVTRVTAALRQIFKFDLHYHAQSSAIMDCLLRNVGSFRWTAFIDFDEYIVPRSSDSFSPSWSAMLSKVIQTSHHRSKRPVLVSGMGFSNVFFYPECTDTLLDLYANSKRKILKIPPPDFSSRLKGNASVFIVEPPDCSSDFVLEAFGNRTGLCNRIRRELYLQPIILNRRNATSSKQEKHVSSVLTSPVRQHGIFRPRHRSKFIVDPLLTHIHGIHFSSSSLLDTHGPSIEKCRFLYNQQAAENGHGYHKYPQAVNFTLVFPAYLRHTGAVLLRLLNQCESFVTAQGVRIFRPLTQNGKTPTADPSVASMHHYRATPLTKAACESKKKGMLLDFHVMNRYHNASSSQFENV